MNPAAAALVALLAMSCGAPPADAPDAGRPRPDASAAGPDVVVTPTVPDGPRRGPVTLGFSVAGGDVSAWRLDRVAGGVPVPATTRTIASDARSATVVWDSFADAPVDGAIELAWVVRSGDDDVTAPFTLELRNAPDTDRLVIVGHALREREGGGATPTNAEASVLVWSGVAPGLVGEPRTIVVGAGPTLLGAAPHGRATVALGEADGTLNIVATPLDALAEGVRAVASLSLPHGWPADVRWSRDGRHLLVAGGLTNSPPQPPVLWRYTPDEALTDFGQPVALANLPGPPSALDVDADGRILVACGSGGEGESKVVLYDANGGELGIVFGDFGPADTVAFAPHGGTALFISSGFSGNQLARFTAGDTGLTLLGGLATTLKTPGDLLFHPDSAPDRMAVLVSQWDDSAVTPVTLTADAVVLGARLGGVPVAGDLDLIERGAQRGTVLVSALMKVVRVDLEATGRATVRGAVIDFGAGARNITHGLAIQR